MFTRRCVLAAITVLTLGVGSLARAEATSPSKAGVVYHIAEAEQVPRALLQLRNQMAAMPGVPVVVIGIGEGIRFMVDGAKDANGGVYSAQVEQLMAQGAEFFACANTLRAFGIDASELAFGIGTVPSGVAAIARLQLEQGYAYVRP